MSCRLDHSGLIVLKELHLDYTLSLFNLLIIFKLILGLTILTFY
jgi:hypothetical protein